ncbi:hypothetical protein [Azohydromonas lata]|uniref:Uncharacterized protein n=1 Tax=Azohydromonas lata TaxID=45677 RepID=A0ABU5IK62_9BURK|nr:hypothetical protein [Azohydromonas lata]MDZ5459285.1 hypothetical protein [Azohydromonas lata]
MKARFIPVLAAAVLSVAAHAQNGIPTTDPRAAIPAPDSLYIADPATRVVITRLLEFHKQQTQESMLLMQRVMQLEGQLNALTARNCNCGTTNQEGGAR